MTESTKSSLGASLLMSQKHLATIFRTTARCAFTSKLYGGGGDVELHDIDGCAGSGRNIKFSLS
jgi:hypothetical protein